MNNPIDFDHYLLAARMIWEGLSPYGEVEFFAPPWMAIFMVPFLLIPSNVAGLSWVLVNILAVNLSALVSMQWVRPAPLKRWKRTLLILAVGLLPSALFSYVTGQVTPLVALAALIVAKEITNSNPNPLLVAVGILVATFKPHLVILPVFLFMLELARQKKFMIIFWCGLSLLIAALFGFISNPEWPLELIRAWISGDYRGGKPGLVAPGYMGLSDLGIPTWVFFGFVIYVLVLWYRNSLTSEIFCLSLAVNLLLLPYRRSYDDVILIFPLISILLVQRPNFKLGRVVAATGLFIIPLMRLSILSPIFMLIGMLLSGFNQKEATS